MWIISCDSKTKHVIYLFWEKKKKKTSNFVAQSNFFYDNNINNVRWKNDFFMIAIKWVTILSTRIRVWNRWHSWLLEVWWFPMYSSCLDLSFPPILNCFKTLTINVYFKNYYIQLWENFKGLFIFFTTITCYLSKILSPFNFI